MTGLTDRLLSANRRFDFRSDACADDTFAVVRMSGHEAISRPYRFELVLVSDDARLDLDAVLAASAHFKILAPDDSSRATPYAGMLAEFDQLHQVGGFTFYRAVLVPRLWQLSLYRNSEVYLHEQTIPEIIEGLLKGARLHAAADGGGDYQLRLTGSYRARSYVCQYQETPLDFISRWMEKEGIYYHFEQAEGRERLVLLDDRIQQPPQALAVNYRPADELDTGLAPDSVQAFVCRTRPLPARVVLQDFNHRRASLPLVVSADVSASGLGEEMIYGENFRTPEEGERYARIRAQELQCGARVFSGEATAVGLRAGGFMDLAHHYRADFDGRYLVTEVTHEGSQAGALLAGMKTPYNEREGQIAYRNSFAALPAAVQFRPARRTAKPRVAGTMNATIDAEGSGEYAELDAHGQYKVQIPFDRTDKGAAKGSAPVRMATPYAGSDHGMHFPLHKGAEVLLSFADGDPDQPVIVGAVPNSLNESVVNQANPHDHLITTRGGNQLHMNDTKGKEVMWLSSPFHDSSIGIGSVDPKGGGSIFTATKGGSDSVSFGTSNAMSFGSKNTLDLSTSATLSAAFTHKVSWGMGISIAAATNLDWKMGALFHGPAFKNLTIDDSKSIKLEMSSSSTAMDTATISGGALDTDPDNIDATTAMKVMRGVIVAYSAVNFAQSTAFATAVNGSDKGRILEGKAKKDKTAQDEADATFARDQARKSEETLSSLKLSLSTSTSTSLASLSISLSTSASTALLSSSASLSTAHNNDPSQIQSLSTSLSTSVASSLQSAVASLSTSAFNSLWDAKKGIDKKSADEAADQASPMNRKSLNGWPGVLGKFGLDALLSVGTIVGFQAVARTKLAAKIERLKLVSKIEVGKDGIKQSVNGIDAPVGAGAGTVRCVLEMSPSMGILLKAAPKARWDDLAQGDEAATVAIHGHALDLQGGSSVTLTATKTGAFRNESADIGFTFDDTSAALQFKDVQVKAHGSQLDLSASTIEIGNKKVIDKVLVFRKLRWAATQNRKAAEEALEKARKFARNQGAMLAIPEAEIEASLAGPKALLEAATQEERRAQVKMSEALATKKLGPMLHGLTISDSEARLRFGTAGVKASNDGLAMSFGSATVDMKAVGLSLDGATIKIG